MTYFSTQVEVEVHRNVYAPEHAEQMTSRFAGRDTEVRSAVSDYLRWLKEDTHKHAERLVDGLKSAEEEIERRLSPKFHSRTLESPGPLAEGLDYSPAESAEGGWVSDDSNTRASRPTHTKSLGGKPPHPSKRGGSAKKRKHIRPSTVETPNISREPSRSRGDRSTTPSPQRYGQPRRATGIPVSRTTSWDVISSYHPRSASVHPDSRRGSVRNLRIESLRSGGMPGSPRELSPARSVRFADSHPPRTPLPVQDTSGLGGREEDSPRASRVAFDLPSDKP